jgi:hypothetical protein
VTVRGWNFVVDIDHLQRHGRFLRRSGSGAHVAKQNAAGPSPIRIRDFWKPAACA